MFSPGETFIHEFVIPFNLADVDYVVVSYKKHGRTIIEKKIKSGFKEHGEGSTSFLFDITQEESLLFRHCDHYTIQVNVLTVGGSRHTSEEIRSSHGLQYLRTVMCNE